MILTARIKAPQMKSCHASCSNRFSAEIPGLQQVETERQTYYPNAVPNEQMAV
jgi:hypothetical protein